jgi:phosphodiesterase/alkaline phosphatase D-like protein
MRSSARSIAFAMVVVGTIGCDWGGDDRPPVNEQLIEEFPEGEFPDARFQGLLARITHGPILGRLSHDGVGVWVRTSEPAEFRVTYQRVGGEEKGAARGQTHREHDNTGWVQLQGLSPNTEYTYAAVVEGAIQGPEPGRFRTLPVADGFRNAEHNPKGLFNFRFEYACGNNQDPAQSAGPELPGFKTMLDQLPGRIYFQIMNGDWIYEEARETTVDQWKTANQVTDADLPEVMKVAPTIAGVWENYKVYLSRGKPLAEWHRNVPAFFTFDDHEILNDIWGAGSPGLRDRRAVFRDIGVQAWRDYLGWSNPLPDPEPQGIVFGTATLTAESDVLEDPDTDFSSLDVEKAATLHVHWGGPTAGVNDNSLDGVGGHPAAGVYEIVEILDAHRLKLRPAPPAGGEVSYSIGMRNYYRLRVSNCDFFLLDTRTHREMHDTKDPAKKGLSMLGPRQKAWLMEGMRSSDADFLFVVSSVNLTVPHVGGGAVRTTNKDDAWTVFLDEREQLIEFWDGLDKPVFVLTGDLHNSFAIRITDRVWEFASGPHNSQNHWYTDEGNRPPSGDFDSGGRKVNIRWSTFWLDDLPRESLRYPHYCVVQVNNVFNNPRREGEERWVAFPQPQVVFQYFDGRTGDLRYAEAIGAKGN